MSCPTFPTCRALTQGNPPWYWYLLCNMLDNHMRIVSYSSSRPLIRKWVYKFKAAKSKPQLGRRLNDVINLVWYWALEPGHIIGLLSILLLLIWWKIMSLWLLSSGFSGFCEIILQSSFKFELFKHNVFFFIFTLWLPSTWLSLSSLHRIFNFDFNGIFSMAFIFEKA